MGGSETLFALSMNVNLMLAGRTGNGKSATGNTILGREAFKSRPSSSGVTKTCELQTSVREDGHLIKVIDTPGVLLDLSGGGGADYAAKEMVRCMDLTNEGIHAVVIVLSVRARFSRGEEATIRTLQTLFGAKILDYAILLFTGGDDLEDEGDTLEDYLTRESPVALKDTLAACNNRCVLFDNKTRSESKKVEQMGKLVGVVNEVMLQNGGQPYTHSSHGLSNSDMTFEAKLQEVRTKLQQQLAEDEKEATLVAQNRAQQILEDASSDLQRQLEKAKEARVKAEERAQQGQQQSTDEIRSLNGSLRRALK